MDSQENLFNSVSLTISPHPSPISLSSYFIWESPIPELSVFTLHYSDGLPFTLSCLQFCLTCISMTISKSQGQSVWFVGIDLCSPVFTHGQLYVALSRATSYSQVRVLLQHEEAGTVTKNVVYKEALLTWYQLDIYNDTSLIFTMHESKQAAHEVGLTNTSSSGGIMGYYMYIH